MMSVADRRSSGRSRGWGVPAVLRQVGTSTPPGRGRMIARRPRSRTTPTCGGERATAPEPSGNRRAAACFDQQTRVEDTIGIRGARASPLGPPGWRRDYDEGVAQHRASARGLIDGQQGQGGPVGSGSRAS